MRDDLEMQEMRTLLADAQVALKRATQELSDAQFALKWTRDKLKELEEEHRKTTMLLVKVVESPDPDDVAALLKTLEKPCGFTTCEKCKCAASTIRQYAKANDALRKEKHGGIDS